MAVVTYAPLYTALKKTSSGIGFRVLEYIPDLCRAFEDVDRTLFISELLT